MFRKNQKAKRHIIILIWIFLLLGCSKAKTFNDLDEFEKYIKGDGSPYLQTVTKNGIVVSLRYITTEAMMLSAYRQYLETREKLIEDTSLSKEQRINKLNDVKKELLKQKGTYEQSLYFHLTIGYEDTSKDIVYEKMKVGYGTYSQWLQKLMFSLKEYVSLQSDAIGKIPLDMYHMERTFGMRKSRTFLLMFPVNFNKQDVLASENKWLELRVKEFGLGSGMLTFSFKLPLKGVKFQIDL